MTLPLWTPSHPETTRMAAFQQWIAHQHHLRFTSYEDLHAWSCTHVSAFWEDLLAFFQVPLTSTFTSVFKKTGPELWQNQWFEGATFNIADLMLRGKPDQLALISRNEQGQRNTWTYAELKAAVGACAAGLKAIGIQQGDRIAAMMPNTPETIIAMLATASLGAIWSSCSPDFGAHAAIDRFEQLSPKALFICDGQHYNGKTFQTLAKLPLFIEQLPSLQHIIVCPFVTLTPILPNLSNISLWDDFIHQPANLDPLPLPFSHPLYILFSSGTTGKPKCIMHSTGGILLQHLKEQGLHCNLTHHDNLLFYTTCGWMMWNWMVSGLALGMTLTLYDGAPTYPTPDAFWNIIAEEHVTALGVSAKYLASLAQTTCRPRDHMDLSKLRLLLSTGSPLLPKQYDFVYTHLKADVQLSSISGGTDIVSCFVLGNPTLPVYAGEIQCAGLGMAMQIYDEHGKPIIGKKGELVCTQPFPSMPLGFWQDPDNARYQETYFSTFKHVWTQGDYAEKTERHTFILYGRSDTTLNPKGVRIGTAEIYRELAQMPEILESVVIGQAWEDDIRVILFVKLNTDETLTPTLQATIKQRLKTNASPRHVPDLIFAVDDIPKTFNGKIVEQAIKQAVEGYPVQNLSSIANPEALHHFRHLIHASARHCER